jgi:hypothetical protein
LKKKRKRLTSSHVRGSTNVEYLCVVFGAECKECVTCEELQYRGVCAWLVTQRFSPNVVLFLLLFKKKEQNDEPAVRRWNALAR